MRAGSTCNKPTTVGTCLVNRCLTAGFASECGRDVMRNFAISAGFAAVIISSPAIGAKSRTLTSAAPSQVASNTSLQVNATSSPRSTQPRAAHGKATLAGSTLAAAPAAAPTPPDGTYLGGCDAGLLSASACQGYYSGNVFDGSPTDI